MRTIYKYELEPEPETVLWLPERAELLYAGIDPRGALCVWALIDTLAESTERRCLRVFGTGWDMGDEDLAYVGSVTHCALVWHVFERVGRGT